MEKTITPEIFPFISETETYAFFARIPEFGHMDNVCLLDENRNIVRELNSDDFYICRHCNGTEINYPQDYMIQYMYYRTDKPVTISYEHHKPTAKEMTLMEEHRRELEDNGIVRRRNKWRGVVYAKDIWK